jgi:nucleoside phosphorylase/CheY-like chemotaxis protein
MRILVIHDRQEVSEQIEDVLKTVGVEQNEVSFVEDGVSARLALQSATYDLAIVDLTIPHIKNKTNPTFSVAEELLVEIFEAATLNPPGDIIGLTKDESALERIDSKIGPHLMAIIEEDQSGAWKSRLKDRVEYVIKAAQSRQRSVNQHYDYDLAIITALDKEYAPFKQIFELTDLPYFGGAESFLFSDKSGKIRKGIAYSVGRAGQASAASVTQAIVTQFRPSLVLMSGFCGGFSSKTVAGEILIADSVFDWDFGKWTGDEEKARFVPRPEPVTIRETKAHRFARDFVQKKLSKENEVLGVLGGLSQNRINKIKMTLGPMASGSAVVAHRVLIDRIQGLNENILGVDMEAYGFAYACYRTPVIRPEFLVVKSVSDFCDLKKDDKDHAACCYLSAKVVEEVVSKQWVFP